MSEITNAMKQICEEKGLSFEAVLSTIESALAAAYRKDYGEKNQNIKVEFDPETTATKVYDVKTVVEDLPEDMIERDENGDIRIIMPEPKTEATASDNESPDTETEVEEVRRFNPKTEIQLSDAIKTNPKLTIGDEIKTELETKEDYGRMAAQTAKQVIIQRLREAERDMVFEEFKDKEGEVVTGVVQRREGRVFLIDLGKAMGVLLPEYQIRGERYNSGERLKVFIREVNSTAKGPEIILSRTSEEILKKVFYLEIPEISNGLIDIKAVAREAGSRSKVAVLANSDNIDPIGSCVGQRGSRIQTIIQELGGEKIDIIEYDEDPIDFIANALAPAKVESVEIDEDEQKTLVKVAEDQLSLAIGKNGQNVRLAARLTGWKIDISASNSENVMASSEDEPSAVVAAVQTEGQEADTKPAEAGDEANQETMTKEGAETKASAKVDKTAEAKEEAETESEPTETTELEEAETKSEPTETKEDENEAKDATDEDTAKETKTAKKTKDK